MGCTWIGCDGISDDKKQTKPEKQTYQQSAQATDSSNDGWTSGRLAKEMLVAAIPKDPPQKTSENE